MSETSPFRIHSLPTIGETKDFTNPELSISGREISVSLGEFTLLIVLKEGIEYLKPLPQGNWISRSHRSSEHFGHTEPNDSIRLFKFSDCSIDIGLYLIDDLNKGQIDAAESHGHTDVGELDTIIPGEEGLYFRAQVGDTPAWKLDASNIWVPSSTPHRFDIVSGSGIHFVGHFPIKSGVSNESTPLPAKAKPSAFADLPA